MLEEKNRIFQNLYNDKGIDVESSKKEVIGKYKRNNFERKRMDNK